LPDYGRDVVFQAPDKDNIVTGSGNAALARLVVYDNRAKRTSGVTAASILSMARAAEVAPASSDHRRSVRSRGRRASLGDRVSRRQEANRRSGACTGVAGGAPYAAAGGAPYAPAPYGASPYGGNPSPYGGHPPPAAAPPPFGAPGPFASPAAGPAPAFTYGSPAGAAAYGQTMAAPGGRPDAYGAPAPAARERC